MANDAESSEGAEEAAAKATAQGGESAQSEDAGREALQQLPYVPHVSGNHFPMRPVTLKTDVPQMYDLYNGKKYDALSKHTNSSMRYEHLALAPALLYLHNALVHSDATLDATAAERADLPSLEEVGEPNYATHSTFKRRVRSP
ncbi:hypothetical protein CYMTET_9659 [Cymbomonas tetramitiformis]|uniref:Uncharacterized protein n=1 Tax=Cymbomonas tetramitiformis TaxID=36881 RepID=A0AAE0GR17_9CHLO|nr:hypothetical protein CYMTET_9659 [Cymbomonas tetramitiformis]